MLDDEETAILDLWLLFRGGGMGPGLLPFGGGVAEQPAALMATLYSMSEAEGRVSETRRERDRIARERRERRVSGLR